MSEAKYLFVLGAPNDDDGKLSPISLRRVDAAVCLCRVDPTFTVVATGGFGAHFNRTSKPHRWYVEAELARRGVRVGDVSAGELESANTVEDAVMISAFVVSRGIDECSIVTSAFHVPRCRLVFGCLLPTRTVTFHAASDPSNLDPMVTAHESRACAALIAQNGVIVDSKLWPMKGPYGQED